MLGSRVGLPLLLGTTAGLFLLLAGVLTLALWDTLVRAIIASKVVLSPGSEVAAAWAEPPVTPLLRVYYFNVTNPQEFLTGERLEVEEVGPYTWQESWHRAGVEWGPDGDTVSSRLVKSYVWREDLSRGSRADLLTLPNVPMFGMLTKLRKLGGDLSAADGLLDLHNQTVFEVRSVAEVTWGYQHPLVDLANQVLPEEEQLPPLYGYFYGKNNSAGELITILTGATNLPELGSIVSVDNETELTAWEGEECNRIHGSDGSLFPPFLHPQRPLYIFSTELCRSLPLQFSQMVEVAGLPAARYTPASTAFTPGDLPCFHPAPTGLFNVSACQGGAPMLLSWPHLLGADPRLRERVGGLQPHPDRHELRVEVLPQLGVALRATIRLQINVNLEVEGVTQLAGVTEDTLLPIIWFEDGVEELQEETVSVLRAAVLQPERIRAVLGPLLTVAGITVLLVCSAVLVWRRFRPAGKVGAELQLEKY